MTENQANEAILDDAGNPIDEEALLRERAKDLGLRISPKIGLDKLREKVNAAMNGGDVSDDEDDAKAAVKETADKDFSELSTEELKALPKAIREAKIRAHQRNEYMKMVRCKIYNLDPSKNDLHGEIFTVSTKYLGTVRKFIPYGEQTEEGWHIPQVIFDALKNRKFLQKKTVTDPKTRVPRPKVEWVPEFSLAVMDPLTKEELAELAHIQQAADRLERT